MTSQRAQASEAELVWMRIRAAFGNPSITTRDGRLRKLGADAPSQPFGEGRDPLGVDDVLARVMREAGWTEQIAQGSVLTQWESIVGVENAAHTMPVGIEDGTLIVQCDTTSWAQQMRNLRASILTKIVVEFPEAGIQSLKFAGPSTRSFQRGRLTVQGRGPRDTWG